MRKTSRCLFATLLCIGMYVSLTSAESALSWRVFQKEENTWVYYPKGLMVFSTGSRAVKPFVLDPVRTVDTLTDCIEYDGYLWVSSNAGLYQIDMGTQSVERISFPGDSTLSGKVALDFDYLWFATDSAIVRFDKLGREWIRFPLPEAGTVAGLWANGNEVFWVGMKNLFRFSTGTEKWNRYPLDRKFGNGPVFYPGKKSFKFIEGARVSLYRPESYSWRHIDLPVAPQDIYDEDSVFYFSDGKAVRRVACETGAVKVLNIPSPGSIGSISSFSDSLIFTSDKRIGKFSITGESADFLEYDEAIKGNDIQKVIPLAGFILLVRKEQVTLYEKETRAWHHVSRSGFRQKAKVVSWNKEEFALRYAPGFQSSMSGNIKSVMSFDFTGYRYDTTIERSLVNGILQSDTTIESIPQVEFGVPKLYGNFNLHTSDKNDRIADLYFNNTSLLSTPKKGLYYRGNRDDRLNTLSIGTTSSGQIESPLLPEVAMEGGNVVFESKARLEQRDRKIVRVAGGAGYITSRTISKVIPYRADGIYRLSVEESTDTGAVSEELSTQDTVKFVKGSCKVYVDGELLDSTQYQFFTSTGTLQFNSLAPIDPVSTIVVEYQVQTVPKGDISEVEFVPSYHFGRLYYGQATLSPAEWISAQVGYTGIDRDSLNSVVNFALPLEFRNTDKKYMLQFRPEVLYNTGNKATAGSAALQGRLGERTGLVANGMYADSAFISTDTLTRGYGKKLGEYDFTVSHDILQELPLKYYQHQRFGTDGTENRYAATAGVRFQNLPFFEANLSRTEFDRSGSEADSAVTLDSLFGTKDKLQLRLYETSSKHLEKLTRFHSISYDISHSEYRSQAQDRNEWKNGRLSTINFSLAPIQRIMFSGETFYRGKMHIEGLASSDIRQSLTLQMIDAPKGVDLSAIGNMKFSRFASEDYSTDTLERSVSLTLKPGQWFSPLGWFSPKAKISQNIRCRFSSIDVPFSNIISGLHSRENTAILREVGVNIYPVDGFLLSNTNEWTKSGDSMKTFKTLNRLSYVFDARNIIQAYWNYSDLHDMSRHEGSFSFDKLWCSWLRTTPVVKTTIVDDEMGNSISVAPKLMVNLNVLNFGIINALSNLHEVEVRWNRHNGIPSPTPDLNYLFGLRLDFKPNIELQIKNTMVRFKEGKFDDFTSELLFSLYF